MANFLLQQDAAADALVKLVASNGGRLLSTGHAYQNFCSQHPEALTAIRASGGLGVFIEARPEFYWDSISRGNGYICLSGSAYLPGGSLESTLDIDIAVEGESNGAAAPDSSTPVRDLRTTVISGDLRSTLSGAGSSRDLRSTIKADSGGGAGGSGAHKEPESRLRSRFGATQEGHSKPDGSQMTRRSDATDAEVCQSCDGNHDAKECPESLSPATVVAITAPSDSSASSLVVFVAMNN